MGASACLALTRDTFRTFQLGDFNAGINWKRLDDGKDEAREACASYVSVGNVDSPPPVCC